MAKSTNQLVDARNDEVINFHQGIVGNDDPHNVEVVVLRVLQVHQRFIEELIH